MEVYDVFIPGVVCSCRNGGLLSEEGAQLQIKSICLQYGVGVAYVVMIGWL